MLKSKIGDVVDNKGYRRKHIAKLMEVSEKQFSNWCTGKSFPTTEGLFKLAWILSVKVDDLYEYVDE